MCKQRAFTLLELLVVISIIALLLGILLPSLRKAKEQGFRVVCASNLYECGLSLRLYANDYDDKLPFIDGITNSNGCQPSLYKADVTPVSLADILKPYIDNFKIWSCPAISKVSPIDDQANIRRFCYSTYYYFPGRIYPDFGDSKPQPESLKNLRRFAGKVMMQDLYMGDIVSKRVYYNHGTGQSMVPDQENPSRGYKKGTLFRNEYGANLLFYDGHSSWYNSTKLKNVGPVIEPTGNSDGRVFSLPNQ